MRFFAVLLAILLGVAPISAKEVKNMDKTDSKTIRLIYPQWQGGNVAGILPELAPDDASRGYILGAQLLNFLAPQTSAKTVTVPVSEDINRVEKNGILGYEPILAQTREAMEILNKENPEKIVILGGECSVSVVPFTYLAKKYNNDVAMVWIDAHPDITLPEDKTYNGYHAMAVTAIMGKGDRGIVSELPANIGAEKILFVGLRDWERQQIEDRQREYGIKHLTCEDVAADSSKILDWIGSTGAKHVVIHFDMDVLEPEEIIAAVGVVPNGMKTSEAARIINDISQKYDVVGLTIAEPMPRTAIKLQNMLKQIQLLK